MAGFNSGKGDTVFSLQVFNGLEESRFEGETG